MVLMRLRRVLLGWTGAKAPVIGSALSSANRVSQYGSLAPGPGPFDSPPDEPVVLDADLPWELQPQPQPESPTHPADPDSTGRV